MWNLGKAYLQIGWDPFREKLGIFDIFGNIIASVFLFFASLCVFTLFSSVFIPEHPRGTAYTGLQALYAASQPFLYTVIGFLPALMHLRRTLNCSFTDMFLGKSRFNLIWFLASIAVTWVTYVLVQLFFGIEYRWSFSGADQVIPMLLLLVAILFQSMVEELIFRGYFSKAVYLLGRSIVLIFVVIPLSFALAHLQFERVALLVYCEMGVFFSYLSLRTGSLLVPTAVHFASNSFAVFAMDFATVTGKSSVLLVLTAEMLVIAFFLEAALRIWGMSGGGADSSTPTSTRDLRFR